MDANHGFQTFQKFLDNQQYTRDGILRYEKIFGDGYVSTGGARTTEVRNHVGSKPAIPSQLYFTHPQKQAGASDQLTSSIANNSKCFKVTRCNTNQFKYSVVNRTIIDWRHLEENVVQAESVHSFKSLLSHTLSHPLRL